MQITQDHAPQGIAACFSAIEDPRLERTKLYRLDEIIVLAICAVICGADSFVAIEEFGKAKEDWLARFLKFENGIPSHDTIGRVLSLIDPVEFERCFLGWVRSACEATDGEVVAIDGKTLRRSYDRGSGKAALHMVSAWASERHMVLGQVKTEEKSNEITAIPELLQVLDLSGCIVSCDAMGCQRAIVEQVIDEGADYVLALKANQKQLYEDVKALFGRLESNGRAPERQHKSTDGDHGRVEVRQCEAVEVTGRRLEDWRGLKSICRVRSERYVEGETTIETRYFISSLPADAERLLEATRTHWHIENKLHWVLDVAFREDESRIREGHAPENMALIRRLALTLLKQETTSAVGIANKRLRAGWDEDYLLKVLQQI